MPRSDLNIVPPISGLDRAWSFQSQPPFTLPDALNCRTRDVFEQRARLGSRPGLVKAFPQNVSTPLESFTIDFFATKDTFLASKFPTIAQEDTDGIGMGFVSSNEAMRSILHFDMTAIPASATIITASLRLFPFLVTGDLSSTMKARVLNQTAWVENEATWNIYSTGNNWSPANAVNPQTGPYLSTPETDWIAPDILNENFTIIGLGPLAQEAYDNYSKNMHVLLMQNSEVVDGGTFFCKTKDAATVSERPLLTIVYEV